MKRKLTCITVVLAGCLSLSCNKDILSDTQKKTGYVGVFVSNSEALGVKSSSSFGELLDSFTMKDLDGQDFKFDAYVSDYHTLPFSHSTKGSVVTGNGADGTESINTEGKTFAFNGWLGSENRYPVENGGSEGRFNNPADETNYHFIANSVATRGSSSWTLNPTSKWRNGVPSTFWSWYPVTDNSRQINAPGETASDQEQAEISFNYTTPADASEHNDLLFAYNLHTVTYDDSGNTNDEETVDIHFYHALAAIRFDVSGALSNGITVNSVFFEDLTVEGGCEVIGGKNGGVSSPGLVTFNWTPGDGTGRVGLEVAASDFSETGLDGTSTNALMPLKSDKFIFVIPQEVTGKVKIGITYTRADGSVHEKTTELSHDAWKPGKIYTYKLNPASDFVEVDVSAGVNTDIMSNVFVKNTGNIYEYVRAVILGNWVVTDGINETLVGPWNYNDSIFSGINIGDGKGWRTGDDGFFYSANKIAPGDSLKLFDSYTAPGAPMADARLNIYVVAQAVAAGDTDNWTDAVTAIK